MKRFVKFLPVLLFLFLTIFLYRQYVFSGKVPFAGNLLVSLYEPWRSYPSPQYPNGPANKPIGFDSLRIFYPLRSLTVDSLKHFELPLWNPYDFAGNTQLATYQSAVFFPLTPLFLIFSQIDAWSMVVFLETVFSASFMYLFLRGLKLSKKSSIIGALAFGFSGGVLVLSEESFMSVYSLMVLPLILLGMQKYFESKKFRWFALVVGGAVWSILSGWFQSTFYVLIFSSVWLIFLSMRFKDTKKFLILLFGLLIAIFLSGPHLIPNIESYLYSARGTTDAKFLFDSYLLPPWHLITYLAPDFFGNPGTYSYFDTGFYYEKILYIGVVGLFLGLLALFRVKKTAEEWFFTISWIVTVSLGLAIPTSWFFLYQLHLPFISTILPSRIFLISAFCLSVVASFGMENLLSKKPNKLSFVFISVTLVGVLCIIWHFLLGQKSVDPLGHFATISYRNMILPSIFVALCIFATFLLLFKQKLLKLSGFILLLVVSLAGIIYFADKYLFFSERQFVFPTTAVIAQLQKIAKDNRVWSFGQGYMERNFATYYHLGSPEGYDSFYIRTYGELVQASQNGGKFSTDIPRADAALTNVSKLSEIENNPSLVKMLNVLGVAYIFAKSSSSDESFAATSTSFTAVWTDATYTIYKNSFAYPRVFISDKYDVIADSKKQLATIFSDATDLSKEIILDKDPKIPQTDTQLAANAKIISYAPEKIVIQADTNKNAMLFLSDNNYPGWVAKVDGRTAPILTADHTFRSIVVPRGKHVITFSYQPESVTIGFLLAGLGVLLFVLVGFTIRKRKV